MYLNEMPVEPNTMFQATFDIGQIEVLRGPQGTLRGRSSPSGAITYTTRRPDLTEVGGYISMLGTSRGDINMQGASAFRSSGMCWRSASPACGMKMRPVASRARTMP